MEKGNEVTEFRLTAGVAETRIQISAKDSWNVALSLHAKDRMREREISMMDVYRVLQFGTVNDLPESLETGGWKCKIVYKIKGGRSVGVVLCLNPDGILDIITVEWEDLK